jgi:glycosyltransferase involved in cell wall biosynthesis
MFPLKPFHKLALRNLAAAIAVSPAVGDQLAKIFAPQKIHVILNGLDVSAGPDPMEMRRQFREFHGIPLDVSLIGTLGELKPLKGQREFVLAAHEIAKNDPSCRFVVAGTDHSPDGKFRRELRRLVKVFGLEERFLWLDWLDDTGPFYSALDIFVSPSRTESFGLAILEAMARGIAVIATGTDGAKVLVGYVGVLTPVNDPVALAGAMGELLVDDARRTSIGSELQKMAVESFSVERMLDATEGLYRQICPAKDS